MTHIRKINEMSNRTKHISEIDVLKYICDNLKNNIKLAKSQYSVQQKDGRYKAHNDLVVINGIVFRDNTYWLMLEDGSNYSMNLFMEDLKNAENIEDLLVIA